MSFCARHRFNTQPPEGGCQKGASLVSFLTVFQHTAARRRLHRCSFRFLQDQKFQHTAARRRLLHCKFFFISFNIVSTHSRPKAAAFKNKNFILNVLSFNTQPPEGGCQPLKAWFPLRYGFNTQPPEGGCIKALNSSVKHNQFQHTAARRRLQNGAVVSNKLGLFQHTAARRRLLLMM